MPTRLPMQWPAPAKLNLFLFITGQRRDGYHTIQTLFQLLDYGDTLTITPRSDGQIQLLTPLAGVTTSQNLIVKAARLLQQVSAVRWGADIILNKRLPLGGGLGGGSSNAATTLAVLNHLWGCGLTTPQLQQLGLILGADVPLFLYGQSAFAQGVGEQLQPAYLEEQWYLVLYPGVNSNTKMIFNHPALKRDNPIRSLKQLLDLPHNNDCEAVAKKCFAQVAVLIAWLLDYSSARLTGSGSCVFAPFPTHSAASKILSLAPAWAQGFVARGINRSPLQDALATQWYTTTQ